MTRLHGLERSVVFPLGNYFFGALLLLSFLEASRIQTFQLFVKHELTIVSLRRR